MHFDLTDLRLFLYVAEACIIARHYNYSYVSCAGW